MEHERYTVVQYAGGTYYEVIDNITHACMFKTKSQNGAHRRAASLQRASNYFKAQAAIRDGERA